MTAQALPKQLERPAEPPPAAKMYKHLGNFPAPVRSSNSSKCETNLRQHGGKISDADTCEWRGKR